MLICSWLKFSKLTFSLVLYASFLNVITNCVCNFIISSGYQHFHSTSFMTLKLLGHDVSLKRNVQALAFKAEEANRQRIENSAGEDFLPNI